MAKTYKVSTVEVSAQSRKEWLARKRGKGEVATSAAAVVVQSEASSAPSALDALFRQVNIGTDDAPRYVAEALFPLRIGDALLDWHADQKYLGVEHATESEKANFFATGGVTAGGIGSSSGGSGGGGSTTLAGLNDVALKSAIANDMLVYNGTHWVNTPMSAIKPDLTAYATKTWVEGKGYALNTALLKVDARLANVETIFETDQDGAINKWSEVVAFLDGIEGDTLDSILAQFATMQWVEDKKYITADALAPYALKTAIPTQNSELENDAEYITAAALNGYATQNWVESKKYLDGIDSTMVINALGYTPYNAANFTKANIKSALGISDWALASAKPTYRYSEIQGIPDLSVYFLKTSFTKDNIKTTLGISDWALAASKPSYKWSEINERPVRLSQFTDDVVKDNYLPIGGTAKNAEKLGGEAPAYYATATALSTLSTAVTEFRTLFDSLFEKDTANNAIKAKLSLYSVGGITAGGIGSGGSSGGGGASYNRLDAWADYTNDKSGWVLSALLGKDLDTRVSALANAGYITASALDPYAKTADVANTYATKTALQGVDIRVQAIEYIFEKDQDGVINKWQEIVDFLAGVEGTTLDAILDQFATKDSLSGYLPLSGGTLAGLLTIPANNLIVRGYEGGGGYDNIINKAYPDGLWGTKDAPEQIAWSIRNAFAFDWYNDRWIIGSVRHSGADSAGFGIGLIGTKDDGTLYQKNLFRIDKNGEIYQNGVALANKYVPKTGGTFSGDVTAPTFIGNLNGTAASANTLNPIYIIDANAAGNGYSWINPYATGKNVPTAGNLISLDNGQNSATQLLSKYSDDTLYYRAKIGEDTWTDWKKIIHTGNLNDLSLARGAHLVNNVDFNNLKSGIYDNEIGNGSGNLNAPSGDEGLYGVLVALSAASPFNFAAQFHVHNSGNIQTRGCYANTWSPWKTIAFTDSNVASATKLQTARTIWGQSFDGTGDVNGLIKINYTTYDGGIRLVCHNQYAWHRVLTAVNNNMISGDHYAIFFGQSESDKNGGYIDYTHSADGSSLNRIGIGFYGNDHLFNFLASGNAGFGTTNPTSKLHVVGGARITDSTTIEKNLFVDKNIYIAESSSDGGIYFGDDDYAFIKETPDDVMTIASNQGLILRVNHISDEGAVIKLDGPVRIGDAILDWDATNKCVTIKNANTGEKASLFVDGGVTATAKN